MDPHHKSIESSLHWHERLLHWSGWEQIVEYRCQLIGLSVAIIALVSLFGWWVARRQSSSVADTLRAEMIVHRLRHPEASSESPPISVSRDLQRLEDLAPLGTPLGARFSGVIAQEEIVQGGQPISQERFSVASEALLQAQLPLHSACVQATMLSASGNIDEAIGVLNTIIEKTGEEFPNLHGYALLEKISSLRAQQKSNRTVIAELERFLASHPETAAAFDRIFSGKTRGLLDFLAID